MSLKVVLYFTTCGTNTVVRELANSGFLLVLSEFFFTPSVCYALHFNTNQFLWQKNKKDFGGEFG